MVVLWYILNKIPYVWLYVYNKITGFLKEVCKETYNNTIQNKMDKKCLDIQLIPN